MNKKKAKIGIFTLAFILLAKNAISPSMASISAAFPETSAVTVQMMLLLPELISVPFVIFGGAIAGRFSKKRLILLGLALFALGGVTGFFAGSMGVLLASRCVFGVGYGLLIPCSLGIAADIFYGTDEYDHVIGMEYSLKSIGSVFYTLLAGVLCGISWHHTFLVYLTGAVVFVVILLLVPDIKPERSKKTERGEKTAIPPILIPAMLVAFAYSFCISANNSNLSYLIEDNGFGNSAVSGVMASLCTVGAAVGAAVYDKVFKRCGDKTFCIGILLSMLGLLCGGFAGGILMVALCVLLLGVGLGVTNPALTMLVGRNSKESTTLFFSLVMASMNLGAMLQGVVIPPLCKAIFGGAGVGRDAFIVAGVGAAVCFAASVVILRRFGRKRTAA